MYWSQIQRAVVAGVAVLAGVATLAIAPKVFAFEPGDSLCWSVIEIYDADPWGAQCRANQNAWPGTLFGSLSVHPIDGGGAVVTLRVQNGESEDDELCNGTVECSAFSDDQPRTKYGDGEWEWAQDTAPTAVGITCRCR